ncbi:universal stress protein (plasmid) [Haloferacaceae archaeon DSL9]
MDRILVVIDESSASIQLLNEAAKIANALESEVILLTLLDEDADQETVDRLWANAEIDDMTRPKTNEDLLRLISERLADTVLKPLGIDYRARGELVSGTSLSDRIIEVAESHGCDHVFVRGKSRSPTGKALFGDVAQSVLVNFDGLVTVSVQDGAM